MDGNNICGKCNNDVLPIRAGDVYTAAGAGSIPVGGDGWGAGVSALVCNEVVLFDLEGGFGLGDGFDQEVLFDPEDVSDPEVASGREVLFVWAVFRCRVAVWERVWLWAGWTAPSSSAAWPTLSRGTWMRSFSWYQCRKIFPIYQMDRNGV
jgi:hypothetical protein